MKRRIVPFVVAAGLLASIGCGAPRPAPVASSSVDTVPLWVRAEAYAELPPELTLLVVGPDDRPLVTCRAGAECAVPRADGVSLVVRYRPAANVALREVRRSVELPSDVRSLALQLRFAEI